MRSRYGAAISMLPAIATRATSAHGSDAAHVTTSRPRHAWSMIASMRTLQTQIGH
jgi:hypothetical protein